MILNIYYTVVIIIDNQNKLESVLVQQYRLHYNS